MKETDYRPDIDGLRCVAVMAVTLFPLDVPHFDGGFVGVDVFFVISGHLITGLLLRDIDAGDFSFAEFYARRIRRILPAMFATVIATVAVGALLMSPGPFADLAKSAIATSLSISNVFFWTSSGYFDTEAVTKPLLHTWSLGIEEQFYLFWPALLFVMPRRWRLSMLTLVSVASLVAAQAWLSIDATGSFFLLPFRVVEFGLGALLAAAPLRVPNPLKEIGTLAGLGLIVATILLFDATTPFPGVTSLIPCLGAVLAIATGTSSSARVLRPVDIQDSH